MTALSSNPFACTHIILRTAHLLDQTLAHTPKPLDPAEIAAARELSLRDGSNAPMTQARLASLETKVADSMVEVRALKDEFIGFRHETSAGLRALGEELFNITALLRHSIFRALPGESAAAPTAVDRAASDRMTNA